jgi:hypothetical protein
MAAEYHNLGHGQTILRPCQSRLPDKEQKTTACWPPFTKTLIEKIHALTKDQAQHLAW